MAYFDGIKRGDRVWDFIYGWGTIIKINYDSDFPIIVSFDNGEDGSFSFEGTFDGYSKQTLFWDEIKFEIPKKPKIKLRETKFLICLNDNEVDNDEEFKEVRIGDYTLENGLCRNDEKTAKKALKQIKRFLRLLALRDQECPDSRGYKFQYEKENYYILKKERTNEYDYNVASYRNYLGVYFKTEEDAQRICDILNSGRFNLKGE